MASHIRNKQNTFNVDQQHYRSKICNEPNSSDIQQRISQRKLEEKEQLSSSSTCLSSIPLHQQSGCVPTLISDVCDGVVLRESKLMLPSLSTMSMKMEENYEEDNDEGNYDKEEDNEEPGKQYMKLIQAKKKKINLMVAMITIVMCHLRQPNGVVVLNNKLDMKKQTLEVPELETKNDQNEDTDLEVIEQIFTINERAIEEDVMVHYPSSSNDASVLEKTTSIANNNQQMAALVDGRDARKVVLDIPLSDRCSIGTHEDMKKLLGFVIAVSVHQFHESDILFANGVVFGPIEKRSSVK
ncbi:hypothetical protein DAPPUDRAFT_262844 [Daphnia pulex]|uniref:Uncharacterized protein n=1 Tax=Daphnia pulex TaxID=6669 RepID=E9HNS7_DAPPU|nr:hypothetical protein DAPPUDRAFT_262844 [Daphnia pulex]|eukprot:EFX66605.1 hypothetical protein DAPPUDRAFT_262844 [Daphnia pulex]